MSIRPIFETLREIRQGALLDEASEELAEVVKRVAETGKGGALLLKLIVKPAGRGSVRTVVILDEVKTKLPTADKEVTVFFPTQDGNLSRQDPSQMNLGLRPVESIDVETGEILGRASEFPKTNHNRTPTMDQSAINALVSALKQSPQPHVTSEKLAPFAFVPAGMSVTSLENYELEPQRVEQKVTLLTAADFVSYWLRYRSDASVIFGDERSATYTAIIDYHGADSTPHWCSHVATYACPKSQEWLTWTGADGKKMTQAEFAEFIEDNYPDIVKPSHAEMIQVSTNLQAKKSVEFSQSTRLDNGQSQLTFQEKVTGTVETKGGSMKVPDEFTLRLPVFLGGAVYELQARLRYRITEGRLAIWYDLHRPHKVVEAATQKVTEAIRKGIGADPMFLGAAA